MKLNPISLLLLGIAVLVVTGCVNTIDGRKKAAWPTAKNKIATRYNRTPDQLWTAARDVLEHHGTLKTEDTLRNVLEASVDERTVWVKVENADAQNSRVTIQAIGKGGGGDVEMAAFIDKQIAVRLAAGNLTPAAARRP